MPNNVKNRLVIIGTDEAVKDAIEKLSTHYPETPRKSYDGDIVYMHSGTEEYGWYNEKKDEFRRRTDGGMKTTKGIPEGFEVEMQEAWTRFPDFNHILPMPESLNITADGHVSALDDNYGFCKNDLLLDSLNSVKKYVEAQEDKEKGEETLKNFVTAVENYLRYGHGTWYGWAPANWGTKWNAYSCEKVNDNTFTFETAWNGVPDLMQKMSKVCPNVTFEYAWSDEDTGNNCGLATFKAGLADVNKLENGSNEAYDLAFELRPHYKEYYELVDGEYQSKED